MRLDMCVLGGGPILSGAADGRRLLAQLLNEVALEPDQTTIAFLDFKDVEVATSSFLRESILGFRDFVRGRRSNYYPVVANPKVAVEDELKELTRRDGVLMLCQLDENSMVSSSWLVGELDPKQLVTYDLVSKHKETDASELMSRYGEAEGTKHPTAWNNRLTSLSGLGLIAEVARGRSKRYRRLFDEGY